MRLAAFFGLATATAGLIWLAGCGPVSRTSAPAKTTGTAAHTAAAAGADSAAQSSREATTGKETLNVQTATFAAGCFWGVEERFRQTPGVTKTSVGYMGGHVKNATYKQVCTDTTGHAEVVQVEFDPAKVSYDQLLDVFWSAHNPTQVNRQGPDVGTQYRTAVFFHGPEQEAAAKASKQRLAASGKHKKPIATEIVAAGDYWMAEDYHQQYLAKRGITECHAPPGDDD